MKLLISLLPLALVSSAMAASPMMITGAGATFPFPIYSKWFDSYSAKNKDVRINYQSIGSGAGIRQFTDKTVDFGASDSPMTDDQVAKAGAVLHIPTVLGAVVLTYNLAEVKEAIRFTPEIIADIFMGKIKKWDDAKLKAANPKLALPAKDILVAYRSDGSGTTGVFTDYLSKISPEWKSAVGAGTAVRWPVGIGGKGNEGVTGVVKNTPGSIGYVELIYAHQNKLPIGLVKNLAGEFIEASPKAVSAAAAGALKSMPADFRVSITNPAGKGAYPISAFTYLLVYEKMAAAKATALKDFLGWAMADGQKMAETLTYAPLPASMMPKVKAHIAKIQSIDATKK